MDIKLKNEFLLKWSDYFNNADLPMVFYFSEGTGNSLKHVPKSAYGCFICELAKVRNGIDLYFNSDTLTCRGAKRYSGYTDTLRADFEYFLSCGNERVEGERYVKEPEMVKQWQNSAQYIPIHQKNIVFKRWDKLTEEDNPEVVIFFAKPDVLSGLFSLYNFNNFEKNSIVTPFGAGCSSIIQFPYLEKNKAFIGMFDPSARKCVPKDELTFAFSFTKMEQMIESMDKSFLIMEAWKKIKNRIE